MSEVLSVKKRESRGKRNARRQRASGSIPAILYGHGGESVSLAVPSRDMAAAIRHGSRVVDLQGDLSEQALIREIQWDTFGVDILHVDFTRVVAGESIPVTVAVELRGDAPGIGEGGVIEHVLHELEIECPIDSIPEKLEANVNHLNLGEVLIVDAIELPAGATVLTAGDRVVVQCVEPQAEIEATDTEGTGAEPEVIGRKAEDEEASGEK